MKLGVVTNPNSRKNRHKKNRVAQLTRLVGGDGIVRQTHEVSELRPVVQEFIDCGLDTWISDGGDGAFHWLVNVGHEVLAARGTEATATPWLVPTNGGTVDFVARKAGLKGSADHIIRGLIGELASDQPLATITVDSLALAGRRPEDPAGELPVRRLGFGIAIGGVGQRFFSHYYDQTIQGPWGIAALAAKGAVGFYTSLPFLRHLPLAPETWRHCGTDILRPTRARVVADEREFPYDHFHALHAGSFTIDVGIVRLFPYADQPGTLHFAVGTTQASEALPGLFDLIRGKPARGERWHEFAGQRLEVWSTGEELLAPFFDGERLTGLEYLELTPGPAVVVPTLRHP